MPEDFDDIIPQSSQRLCDCLAVSALNGDRTGVIAELDGQLKHEASALLQDFLAEQLRKYQAANLTLNCKRLDFVDSQGLALLLLIQRLCEAKGGTLQLQAAPPLVRNLLRLTRFDSLIKLLD